MAKRRDPNASKFVPCVATHFFHRAVTLQKKLQDLSKGMTEYDGMQDEEIASIMQTNAENLELLSAVLYSKSSLAAAAKPDADAVTLPGDTETPAAPDA